MMNKQTKIDPDTINIVSRLHKQTKLLSWLVALLIVSSIFVLAGFPLIQPGSETNNTPVSANEEFDDSEYEIVDGLEVSSGMKVDDHWEITKISCTPCHSAKLVTQNRATRDGWEKMIKWMQETQGLWDLGENEPLILDYLAKNYGVSEVGMRSNLIIEDWYEIK